MINVMGDFMFNLIGIYIVLNVGSDLSILGVLIALFIWITSTLEIVESISP